MALCLCVLFYTDAGMLVAEGGVWRHPGHVRHVRFQTVSSSSHVSLAGEHNTHAWPA